MEQITLEAMNKKINELNEKFEKLKEDIEFSRRIRDSWERYDKGNFKNLSKEDFLEELEKW
jgi:hypothetical protein